MAMRKIWAGWLVILTWLSLTAGPTLAAGPGQSFSSDGHGYALLYRLLGDEQNVSKLLLIKKAPPDLRELIKAIAHTASEEHKQLEKFAKADSGLNLKDDGLPSAEVAARESISKATAKELLTASGKDLELGLLLSQKEALTYGEHLALALGKTEKNSQRLQFLREVSTNLGQLRQKVMETLSKRYAQLPAP